MSNTIRHIRLIGLICLIGLIGGAKTAHALSLRNTSNNLGLVGYYSLNEGTSTKATDFSGKGNTGTLTGSNGLPTWTAGKRGKALNFDGVDDYVAFSAASMPAFNLATATSEKTISAWIKTSALDAYILESRDSTGNPVFDFGIGYDGVDGQNNRKLSLLVRANDGSGLAHVHGNTVVSNNLWHHVVATRNSSKNLHLYVDGVLDDASSVSDTMTASSTFEAGYVRIGKEQVNNYFFTGSIDDVRIYNRALSATEVANMYNDGQATIKAKDNTGLVGYWSFEDGAGTKATDFSGQGNAGVLTGSPTWGTGKRGKGISLSGSNYVKVTTSLFDTMSTFTYSAWARHTTSGVANVILSKASVGAGTTGEKEISINANNTITARVRSNTNPYTSTSSNTVTDTNWHLYTFTHDVNGDRKIKIYLDGVEVSYSSQGTTAGSVDTAAGSLFIGSVNTYNYWIGSIDDVRIYNRALTAQQVLDLYNAGATTASPTIKTVSRNGLVGYWSLDDGVGTSTTDFSGLRNTGTLLPATSTPTWVTGKRGKGLQLSADFSQRRYVEVTGTTAININASGTVALWFKGSGIESAEQAFFSKGCDGSQLNGIRLVTRTNIGLTWYLCSASTSQTKNIGTSGTVVNGAWYHAAFTWDGSNVKTYLNGSLADSTAQTVIPVTTVDPIRIGNNAALTRNFAGTVDEVRVYNRALNATEVQTLYNIGR